MYSDFLILVTRLVLVKLSILSNIEVSGFSKLAGTRSQIRNQFTKVEYFTSSANEPLYVMSTIQIL